MIALFLVSQILLIIVLLFGVFKMAALDDALAALTAAVGDNSSAVDAAVVALGKGGVSDGQLAALKTATDTVVSHTAALKAATPA